MIQYFYHMFPMLHRVYRYYSIPQERALVKHFHESCVIAIVPSELQHSKYTFDAEVRCTNAVEKFNHWCNSVTFMAQAALQFLIFFLINNIIIHSWLFSSHQVVAQYFKISPHTQPHQTVHVFSLALDEPSSCATSPELTS